MAAQRLNGIGGAFVSPRRGIGSVIMA
jgi:hypothetical protein